ncbi:transcriptional regulator, AraC family [Dickeya parazeae Ech586]|uniref:Transcriptional regulator, AraC family n=1 Tax=Dickeya zeae (strain Ech586) TaxID=590409 RepID=D2BST7_DICZ5|nr:helix-turn-helix domain-containing protein [Dickeya parazeae]ACZ77700.1 transcriptional regulator, AraC family [Dickeya parazeae Ech586]PZR37037.1 MAG: AraC family transcriptional regulator [Azospira oryzae]
MIKLEELITEIIQWIDDNIHQQLSIDDVAARSGYSKWHLQRVFFQKNGKNIAAYIRDKKLALAAYDLVESKDRVLDIGFRYGFDSQQSFTRSFSKKYSIPPQKYRRLYTGKYF